jgi:phosphoribosyl-AMP cyclohydrolase
MALAYRLVDEYVKHEKEQDALQKKTDTFVSSTPKRVWTKGGMIKK